MTKEELKKAFLWYEKHSYQASRASLESKYSFTLFEIPMTKDTLDYKKFHSNMMAEFYLNPDYVGGEPESQS